MTDLLQAEADVAEAMTVWNFAVEASSLVDRVKALAHVSQAQGGLLDAQAARIHDLEAEVTLLRAAAAAHG